MKIVDPPLSYIRKNVALPGENFIAQWNPLTEKDKADCKQWATDEIALLNAQDEAKAAA